MDENNLGTRVKSLRKSSGLSQKDLSASANITPATLSRIEAGKIRKIRPETLIGLSQALGVSAEYLTCRTNQINPSNILESDSCFSDIFASYMKLGRERRETLRNMARFLAAEEDEETSVAGRAAND